jgi:hypothetical protein
MLRNIGHILARLCHGCFFYGWWGEILFVLSQGRVIRFMQALAWL